MNMAMTSLFTRLISGAASGFSAPFGWLLMQKPLRYMEKDALGRHPKAGVRHNQWLDEIAAGFDGRKGQTVVTWHHVRGARMADISCLLRHYPFVSSFCDKLEDAVRTGRYGFKVDDTG